MQIWIVKSFTHNNTKNPTRGTIMLEDLPLHLLVDILLRYCTAKEIRIVTYCSKQWLCRLSQQDFLWKSLLAKRSNVACKKLRVGTFHQLYMRSIRGEKLLEIETLSSRSGNNNHFQLVCQANASQFALKQKIRNTQHRVEGKSFEDFELVVQDTNEVLGVSGNDFIPARDSLDIAVAFANTLGIPANVLPMREVSGWERTIAQLEDGAMLTQVHCKEWMQSTTWLSALHFTQAVFTKAFAMDVVLIRAILTSGLFLTCYRVCRNFFTSSLERHLRPLLCEQVSALCLIKLTLDLLLSVLGALLPVIHSALRVEVMRILVRVLTMNKDFDLTRERMYINLGWALREAFYTNARTGRMDSIQYAASSLIFWTLSRIMNCTLVPQILYSIPTAYCTFLLCIALENVKSQQLNFEIT